MHIPKTAGSSLIDAIVSALQPPHVLWGFDRCLFGGFSDFASLDQELRQRIFLDEDAVPHAGIVAGHISLSTLRHWAPTACTMTLLREPVSRLLSHWLFWRGHDDSRLEPWGAWADYVRLSRLPLPDFLAATSLACQNDNVATRMLLWPHRLIPRDGFIAARDDRRLLADARRALDSMDFVDLVENPAMVENVSTFLGGPITLPHHNPTGKVPGHLRRPMEDDLTFGALAALNARSRLDAELWRHVGRRRLSGAGVGAFRTTILLGNAARFAGVMGV